MGVVALNPDEILALKGDELGVTAWVEVTQESVDAFARVTRDEQWIHVDPSLAADGPFGRPIAHGFYTLSLCSHFFGQLLAVREAGMVVNYGLERVRFPSPVPVGSRVRASGRLLDVEKRGPTVHTVTRLTIEIECLAKPACVADQVSRFYPAVVA